AFVSFMVPETARLELKSNSPLREFGYTRSVGKHPVKAMLMGPDRVAQMCDLDGSKLFYASADELLVDVVRIQRQMVQELIEAGCDYVQLDEPSYTGYVDTATLNRIKAHGDDPMVNIDRAIAAAGSRSTQPHSGHDTSRRPQATPEAENGAHNATDRGRMDPRRCRIRRETEPRDR
ncbi:MAG: hypothetical protein IH807_10915, partial [Proteobacteria bacterium]|nr:hypothetical protein [Pseudomonadota bacterium]